MQERVTADREARELPTELVNEIIKDAEQSSVALQLGNVIRMRSFETKYRLQNSFPGAFWQTGTDDVLGASGDGSQLAKDSAFKKTTKMSWTSQYLRPDELAVLVVLPDNWRDDSDITWGEIRTALRTAFAKAIDRAIFFGISDYGSLPSTFGNGIVPDTIEAGNFVVEGESGNDLYDDYAAIAQLLDEGGYSTNGFVTGAGETWRLKRERDDNNRPLWDAVQLLVPGGVNEVRNGTWERDMVKAIAGDFEHLHIGIRQDMTVSLSTDSPIFDPADGSLIYAPFQQDGAVLRAVMRLGYTVTAPLKHLGGDYPFAALVPENYSS